jgi:hypothetical protein
MSLDATPGGENSNSYVTVREADIYFGDRLHADAWGSLSYLQKSTALITATSLLDWYMEWLGSKSTVIQALDFPRTGVYCESIGTADIPTEAPSDTIPQDVKTATFELSLSILAGDRTLDWNLQGIDKMKVGDLEMSSSKDIVNNPKPATIPEKIYKILSCFIEETSSNGIKVVRLMRA